eukprot:759106-Hanusia_phi.AAC.2
MPGHRRAAGSRIIEHVHAVWLEESGKAEWPAAAARRFARLRISIPGVTSKQEERCQIIVSCLLLAAIPSGCLRGADENRN